MELPFTERASTWGDLDAGLRIVEWTTPEFALRWPRPTRFEEQQWSPEQSLWLPTGRQWDDSEWNEKEWWHARSLQTAGP